MKRVSLECLQALLPNFIAGWTSAAAGAGLVATGVTVGAPATAALAVSGLCALLAIQLKDRKDAKRSHERDRQAVELTRQYAHDGRHDFAQLQAQLAALGYEIRFDSDALHQRLDALEALAQLNNPTQDELAAFFEKHEGLFISLADFLEASFDEVKTLLGRQDLKLDELIDSNQQMAITLAAVRRDFQALSERLTAKYERAERQMGERIDEQKQLIALQQDTLRDRERRIADLESALRQTQAAADAGDADARAAIDAIRATGDLQLLRDTIDRFADQRRAREREQAQQQRERYIAECKESASISETLGDTHAAMRRYRLILEEDPADVDATNRLGHLLDRIGDLDAAAECYGKLTDLRPDDLAVRAVSLGNLGLIAMTRGNLDQAECLHRESLKINRKLGRLEGQASELGNLGLIAMTRGDLDEAERLLRESLEIHRKLGRLEGQANQLGNLGLIAKTHGDLDEAERLHREALDINRKLGRLVGQANQLGNLGLIAKIRGDLDQAEQLHREALEINRKLGRLEGQASDLGNLGTVAMTRGDLDEAERLLHESLDINRKLGELEGQASSLGNLGLIARTRGDLDEAERLHRESLEIERKLGRLEGQASDLGNLGAVAAQRGQFAEAREFWTQSRDLFARIGMPHMQEQLQGWLDQLPPAPP